MNPTIKTRVKPPQQRVPQSTVVVDEEEGPVTLAEPEVAAPAAHRPAEHTSMADIRDGAQRDPDHHERRRRRRSLSVVDDQFAIPREEIPEGLDYQWKRFSVHGQEDPFYLAQMRNQGWEPVPPSRHPTWLPPGYKEPNIIKGGLILMDTIVENVQDARAEARTLALRQVREAEQRLGKTPKDTMTRDHDGAKPRIVKEIGRMVPTAEE